MPVYLSPERQRQVQDAEKVLEIWKGPISVDGERYQSLEHYWVVKRRWLREGEYCRLEESLSGRVESRG